MSSQLVFSSAGNERIRVPSATPIELVGGLAIGPVTPVLAIQGAAANDRLQLNPTVAFTNGVDINNGDMFIRRSGSAARVGIGFAGDTLAGSRGMLEVLLFTSVPSPPVGVSFRACMFPALLV